MVKKLVIFIFMIISIKAYANIPFVTLSGDALSGVSGYKSESQLLQFETAANVNLNVEFSEKFSTNIIFGLSAGQSETNFSKDVVLQGFALTYTPGYYNTTYTLGMITIPIGQFAEDQSFNAKIGSQFLYNDLGYSFFAQGNSLVDFASSGIASSTIFPDKYGSLDLVLFNGTDMSNKNKDGGFGSGLRYKNSHVKSFLPWLFVDKPILGVSLFHSNDRSNQNENDGLNADTTAFMIDGKGFVVYDIELGGYFMHVNMNDSNANTNDNFDFAMVYASKKLDNNITLGGRYSIFRPKDINGEGNSALSFTPGLGDISSLDAPSRRFNLDVTRVQFSGTLRLEDNLKLHNELVFDKYPKEFKELNNSSVLSYIALNF